MGNLFLIKLTLSFITGSIWITFSTIIAEKFGSKLGGVIAGLPSTIVISLFFIGWTQDTQTVSEASTIVPIVMGIDGLFVLIYILLCDYNFIMAISSSLIIWFILSLILAILNFNNLIISLLGFIFLLLISYYIPVLISKLNQKRLFIQSERKNNIKYTFIQLLIRGLVSGSIITFAVIMAKVSGPLFGGIFACFPAVMLSTMIVTYYAHGSDFSKAVLRVLMISGPVNVVIYSLVIHFLIIPLGLVLGTLLAFIISLISGYFVYLFVSKKMRYA